VLVPRVRRTARRLRLRDEPRRAACRPRLERLPRRDPRLLALSSAQQAGIPTGTTPVVGALVVFPRGYGGSAVGHVACVEQVNADGSYVVSERNWNYNPDVTERHVEAGIPGVGVIYGGAAGNGPTPPPSPAPGANDDHDHDHHDHHDHHDDDDTATAADRHETA
jgi:hypothetical protein